MNLIASTFSTPDLERITAAIGEAERKTAGEVRVEIRQKRSRSERSLSVEAIARREFVSLGMSNTKGNTGVLIFVMLEDRQFCILADEGIHAAVGQDTWTAIAADMTVKFKERAFTEGVIRAVREVGAILRAHVPRQSDDTNELPNEVRVR